MADLTDADKQYRHSHSQHLRDEDHLRIARHVAKAVTDAELDRLVATLRQAGSWHCDKAATAITTLRARIAEDQAQIAALTTYRENLRDEVIELRARIAELEAFQQQAIKQVCELAREAGEAKGKLEASELPGIVDGWREKCERLERRVAELEARLEIDPAHPYDGIAARDAHIAALEADRAEWVEVERLRMGKQHD